MRLALALLLAACSVERAPRDAPCRFNSDCADALVCANGVCRAECAEARDCERDWTCGPSGSPRVRACLPPASPVLCAYDSECPTNARCIERQCRSECLEDRDCPDGTCVEGVCTAPIENPADAGMTGALDAGACPLTCGSRCVDPMTDPNHCGACGNGCSPTEGCMNGVCTGCAPGLSGCGTECVDFGSDSENCGGCGVRCSYACRNGMCSPSNDQCSAPLELMLDDEGPTIYRELDTFAQPDVPHCNDASAVDTFYVIRPTRTEIVYLSASGTASGGHLVRKLEADCPSSPMACPRDTCDPNDTAEWLGILAPGDHYFMVEGNVDELYVEHVPIDDIPATPLPRGMNVLSGDLSTAPISTGCGVTGNTHAYYWAGCVFDTGMFTATSCGSASAHALTLAYGDLPMRPTCGTPCGDDSSISVPLTTTTALYVLFVRGTGSYAITATRP